METLQRKLSGTSLDVPVPPPRRSVATNDNNPYPSAPEISETSSTDELLTRLASVEQMNKDWLIYNETREQFVQQVTAKHHETINQLRRAMEEIHRMQQCPGALSEEQRKHYDGIRPINSPVRTEQARKRITPPVKAPKSRRS